MKKIFLVFSLLLLPGVCAGAVSYIRTPAGNNVVAPVNIAVDVSNTDCPPLSVGEFWTIQTSDGEYYSSDFYFPQATGSASFSPPVGYQVVGVEIDFWYLYGNCHEDFSGFRVWSVDYSRAPSGYNITSPVSVSVSAETIEELCETNVVDAWRVSARKYPGGNYIASTEQNEIDDLTGDFTLNLPSGEYDEVAVECREVSNGEWTGVFSLEYNNGEQVFEVSGSWLLIAPETAPEILEYPGRLFTDLTLFIVLILGLPVGYWIIENAIKLFNDKK